MRDSDPPAQDKVGIMSPRVIILYILYARSLSLVINHGESSLLRRIFPSV